jgi:hypothetical protein
MKKTVFFLMVLVLQMRTMQGKCDKELQLAISYNRMTWKVSELPFTPNQTFKRNRLLLQPCLRFAIHSNVLVKDTVQKISLSTFVGFHIFGGKSKDGTSSYKDKLAFYTFEVGVYPSFHIHQSFSLGAGFKVNFTPLIVQKSYGTLYQSNDKDREWFRENVPNRFKKFSGNAGFIARYKNKRFTIAMETWVGLIDLNNIKSPMGSIKVRETNYRVQLGYMLGKGKK